MWIRRSVFHHVRVGESLTPFSDQTTSYLNQLDQLGLQGQKGLAQLNVALGQQADMLSINDCFYWMGWIFLACLLVLPFGRTKKAPQEKAISPAGNV